MFKTSEQQQLPNSEVNYLVPKTVATDYGQYPAPWNSKKMKNKNRVAPASHGVPCRRVP